VTDRLPSLKASEVIHGLERAGFQIVRQRGSHMRMRHPDGAELQIHLYIALDQGYITSHQFDGIYEGSDANNAINAMNAINAITRRTKQTKPTNPNG